MEKQHQVVGKVATRPSAEGRTRHSTEVEKYLWTRGGVSAKQMEPEPAAAVVDSIAATSRGEARGTATETPEGGFGGVPA
ncbi:hypothetical protein CCMA1212_002888 [Trichoderma ghanense]|uniref:Uncharacterized protein n=1 Tax=Trichoderma ghanense TaxID=65468 RepID=A0ABY2HBU0_9HYPO